MPDKNADAGSVSSAGSSMSEASASGGQGKSGGDIDRNDERELLEVRQGMQPVFAVLYTLSAVKYDNLLRFASARIILEFLQLLLLVLRPAYGFVINDDLWVWHAIKWLDFASPLSSDGYDFFIPWIYVGTAILVCSLSLGAWVSWCFSSNHFPYMWPVMVLRLVVYTAVFLFYIGCMTVFLTAFNCNWFLGREVESGFQAPAGNSTAIEVIYAGNSTATEMMYFGNSTAAKVVDLRFHLHRFPEVECLKAPHFVHGIVAFIACGVLVLIAYAVTLTDCEPNPASRRWMATPHSSVELWALTTKTIMVLNMAIFTGQLYIQSIIMCLATLFLCYLYIRWQPYYNEWVNHIRSGLSCMLLWISIFSVIMKFDHRRDQPNHLKWLTDAMLAGLAPVLVLGFFLSFARLRLSIQHILKAIGNAPEGTRLKDFYWFSTPQEVEIASRVLRQWIPGDDELLDPDAVRQCELILQIGHSHFSNDPKLVLAYANFMLSVQENHQEGSAFLQHASKLDEATVADRFIVFVREQEQKQQSKAKKTLEGSLDLVAYVEFQRDFRAVARAYRQSLMMLRKFWHILVHQDVSFKSLLDGLADIEASAKRTDKIFKVLVDRYPSNEQLFRLYARFLEHVRSDPWTSNKFSVAADEMDNEAGAQGAANIVMNDDPNSLLEAVNEKAHAMIVIRADGIMLVANKQALKMFGYKKAELEGKNVSMLMPPPFQQRHNGYLRTFINTGKKRILDSIHEVVALPKSKHVFPIQLAVTKVSGTGNDSIFMGVMRQYLAEEEVIRVWCTPSGAVISVDERFFDSFGKAYADVAGRPLSSLVRDQGVIIKLLEKAQAASEQEFRDGHIFQKEVFVLHQYMDPVQVDVAVDLGGTDTQRLLAFNMRVAHKQGPVLVTDLRGKLLYMNSDTRNLLGYELQQDVTKTNLSDLMPPPFALLHTSWMKNPSPKVPKQSCRNGATVIMVSACGATVPVRPKIEAREAGESVIQVVHLENSTVEQGLDERRLVLKIDTRGYVTGTNTAQPSLFGFIPSSLIGKRVSAIVDVLAKMEDNLEHVLSQMAQKVALKPGYSWRVGVHPATKPLSQMSIMELAVQDKSTCPALMMLELKEVEDTQDAEPQVPQIFLHLYKADMLNAIIELDNNGTITRPAVSQLDPTGLLFGCSDRSMVRRPICQYLHLSGKALDLLHNDKEGGARGAMKKGTSGARVGPVKVLNGYHADGSPLCIRALVVSHNNKLVMKCGFEELDKGNMELFKHTLVVRHQEGRDRSRCPSMYGLQQKQPGQEALNETKSTVTAEARAAVSEGAKVKAVKFADSTQKCDNSDDQSTHSLSVEEEEEEEEGPELRELMNARELEAERPEVSSQSSHDDVPTLDSQAPSLEETDWCRGRRLKRLYYILNTEQARRHYTRYFRHTCLIIALLAVVHTALFGTWINTVQELESDAREMSAGGRVIIESQTVILNAEKINNMYRGKTSPIIYENTEEEMQITLQIMEDAIDEFEKYHQGLYLGFDNLRRFTDPQLLDLWEGSKLEEELYLDIRQPRFEESGSNLWQMGNRFIASAHDIIHNHKAIALQTDNDFTMNSEWRYITSNGPETLAAMYVQSLSLKLQEEMEKLQERVDVGWACMVVDLVVCAVAFFWSLFLLKGVSQTRHHVFSALMIIPTGFLRKLADRQVQLADEDGAGIEEDDDDEEGPNLSSLPAAGAAIAAAAGPQLPRTCAAAVATQGAPREARDQVYVVDVDGRVDRDTAPATTGLGLAQLSSAICQRWRRLAAFIMKEMASRMSEAPIEVGKRKLTRYRKDTLILVAPFIIWAVLILIIFPFSISLLSALERPMVNQYLAARLSARTTRVTSDAHSLASQDDASVVQPIIEGGMATRFSNLHHMYNSLLYGQTTDKRDMGFLELGGTLFDSFKNRDIFFGKDQDCKVEFQHEKYCYHDRPSHRFHLVTTHGMDSMMQRYFDEVQMMMAEDPNFTVQQGMGGTRMDYIWNVGAWTLASEQQFTQGFYAGEMQAQASAAMSPQVALLVILWIMLAAYCYFQFLPFKRHLDHELRQVAQMASQVPHELNIESSLAQAVGLTDNVQSAAKNTVKE